MLNLLVRLNRINMSFFVLSETLRNYFSQYGEVVDCVIMKDKSTNQSRGFGFVKFKDPNCVRTVLDTKPHNLDGRNVRSGCLLFYILLTVLLSNTNAFFFICAD